MRLQNGSSARLATLLTVIAGAMFLASCGSTGTTVTEIALPVITVSPATASLPAGGVLQFTATVVSQTSTTLTWSVNNILGGNATLGTINAAGLYTAPATVPSPSTVTIKATSTAETNPSGSAILAITAPAGKVDVSVSPAASSISTGALLQFTAGVNGTSNTSVLWTVNGVAGGNSTLGTINSTGLFTAPATVPSPATVTVVATSVAEASASSAAIVTITAPATQVSVSPGSTSVWAGSTAQFTATYTGATNYTVKWSVNGILGGNSSVGTICNLGVATCTSPGLFTAPAISTSPATETITAAILVNKSSVGSGSASVTLTPPVVEGIGPTDTSVVVGTPQQLAATTIPANSLDVKWWVNGVNGGNSTVGTITSAGLYTAPSSAPSPATVVVGVTGQGDTTDIAATTLTLTAANAAPLFVNFGPNGNTGNPNTAYYNGVFTSVKVCLQGTITCQTIPDILVETGSVGLRVLNSQLTTVPASELGTIKDSLGNQVQECVQFGDTSYAWGPVLIADVAIAGEKATSVPIQVIGGNTFPVPASGCLSLGTGPSLDTAAALGANGILGVGNTVQDCGPNCAAGQTFSSYPYYVCPIYVCQAAAVPVLQQVRNPVASFTKDNNGVEILLPSIPATGAPLLPYTNAAGTGLIPAGLLLFGVGTESNNAVGNATIYATDSNGNFAKVVYNGVTYTSGGFLDTGSNALYVSDPATLGIPNCSDNSYYCPASTFLLSLTNYGTNGTSGTAALSIANADTLFGTNPSFAAFSNLAGASGEGTSTDYFDLGLPFFFGRPVFVGIAGTTVPNNASAPNGYYAY
jgi:hypothetical protein